ncbi:MAG: class I SAM-dependent methyltransferase [Alphaproteobacteria bacterium]|nr:class I SAM-dependent methyltransferase [Alphaproteobacteria bacterium]
MTVVEGYQREYRPSALLDNPHCYPVEFVVRCYLGRYPGLAMDKAGYAGASVLDLGFGDGRNLPLLRNLGMRVHGIEITEGIVTAVAERMRKLDVDCTLAVGTNAEIPYPDATFDHVLACHSLYYIGPGTRFSDNIREIARVMKPGARLVFSAPMTSAYYIREAATEDGLHFVIKTDPLGIRQGSTVAAFEDTGAIEAALAPSFTDLILGSCRDDYFGLIQDMWIGVATRA